MTRRPAVWLAIAAAASVGAIEGIQGYGVSMLTPEFATTLTVGVATLVAARVLGFVLGGVLYLVIPAVPVAGRATLRAWSARVSAVLCALVLACTGTVSSTPGFVGVLCLTAVVGAPIGAFHRALVVDLAPAQTRIMALSTVQLAALLAQVGVAADVAAGGLSVTSHAFEILGLVALGLALLASVALRTLPADRAVCADNDVNHVTADVVRTTWKQTARSWRATPTLLGIVAAMFAIGMLQLPFAAVFSIYLRSRWGLSATGAGTVFLVVALASVVVVMLNARRADRQLTARPDRVVSESWVGLLVGSALLAGGVYAPSRVMMVALVAVGSACVAAVVPQLSAFAFDLVPLSGRFAVSAGLAAALAAGAATGVAYATAFENRHGPRSALVAIAVIGVLSAGFWRAKSASMPVDRQRVRDAALDREARAATVARGGHVSLLACRGIDFSYGALQVLYDVDFAIDDGEVVALLGTNGAGKSTLLKVISGIGLPQRGSVRFAGRDITYLDAEDRVRAGITQVPGGRAVFGSMTVIENLQTFGFTLGRNRRTVDAAIERCVAAFPWIAERGASAAATLSGGEQQMVGLCKALILRPRLLLIDELSLGLAPVVIGPLLDLVREINATGTAVVVVEQSVNIALSLVDNAYFMEKGSIRFNGRAKDLLERQDLLRAVFLEGAAKSSLS